MSLQVTTTWITLHPMALKNGSLDLFYANLD